MLPAPDGTEGRLEASQLKVLIANSTTYYPPPDLPTFHLPPSTYHLPPATYPLPPATYHQVVVGMLTASLGGSVHGAALLCLQARLPSYHPFFPGYPPSLAGYHPSIHGAAPLRLQVRGDASLPGSMIPGYHPYQACAGRGAELGDLGAVEALGQARYLVITPVAW